MRPTLASNTDTTDEKLTPLYFTATIAQLHETVIPEDCGTEICRNIKMPLFCYFKNL